jgi:hypothetical protein
LISGKSQAASWQYHLTSECTHKIRVQDSSASRTARTDGPRATFAHGARLQSTIASRAAG